MGWIPLNWVHIYCDDICMQSLLLPAQANPTESCSQMYNGRRTTAWLWLVMAGGFCGRLSWCCQFLHIVSSHTIPFLWGHKIIRDGLSTHWQWQEYYHRQLLTKMEDWEYFLTIHFSKSVTFICPLQSPLSLPALLHIWKNSINPHNMHH